METDGYEEDIYARRAAKGGSRRDVARRKKGLRRGGVQGQERRDKERTDETTGAGEKEITAGSDRVVEINVARLIGATEECACGLSGSQPVFSVCHVPYPSNTFNNSRYDSRYTFNCPPNGSLVTL